MPQNSMTSWMPPSRTLPDSCLTNMGGVNRLKVISMLFSLSKLHVYLLSMLMRTGGGGVIKMF